MKSFFRRLLPKPRTKPNEGPLTTNPQTPSAATPTCASVAVDGYIRKARRMPDFSSLFATISNDIATIGDSEAVPTLEGKVVRTFQLMAMIYVNVDLCIPRQGYISFFDMVTQKLDEFEYDTGLSVETRAIFGDMRRRFRQLESTYHQN
jgi:hypothetical protein